MNDESQDVDDAPLDGDSREVMVCDFCHKEFVGQAYYLTDETGDSGLACSSCNRIDSRIARQDAQLQAQQVAQPASDDFSGVSGSGDFVGPRGGSGWKCPRCGKMYYNYSETDKSLHLQADAKYGS